MGIAGQDEPCVECKIIPSKRALEAVLTIIDGSELAIPACCSAIETLRADVLN